jgi:GAF domain-containing protein
VIEVLDSRDGAFTGSDLELASAFARQAAIAVDAFRVEREFPLLVARSLASYDVTMDADLNALLVGLGEEQDDDFWSLVDEIAGLADVSVRTRSFVLDLLPLVHRHFQESKGLRFGR